MVFIFSFPCLVKLHLWIMHRSDKGQQLLYGERKHCKVCPVSLSTTVINVIICPAFLVLLIEQNPRRSKQFGQHGKISSREVDKRGAWRCWSLAFTSTLFCAKARAAQYPDHGWKTPPRARRTSWICHHGHLDHLDHYCYLTTSFFLLFRPQVVLLVRHRCKIDLSFESRLRQTRTRIIDFKMSPLETQGGKRST